MYGGSANHWSSRFVALPVRRNKLDGVAHYIQLSERLFTQQTRCWHWCTIFKLPKSFSSICENAVQVDVFSSQVKGLFGCQWCLTNPRAAVVDSFGHGWAEQRRTPWCNDVALSSSDGHKKDSQWFLACLQVELTWNCHRQQSGTCIMIPVGGNGV